MTTARISKSDIIISIKNVKKNLNSSLNKGIKGNDFRFLISNHDSKCYISEGKILLMMIQLTNSPYFIEIIYKLFSRNHKGKITSPFLQSFKIYSIGVPYGYYS